MNKLKTAVRVAELDTVSSYLVSLFKQNAELSQDEYLVSVMSKMEDLSERLTIAIKADKIRSQVYKADANRDEIIRLLIRVLKGYAALPITEQKEAAERILQVLSKYKGIVLENNDEESSHIESLLKDLSVAEFTTDIQKLNGVGQYLNDLRAAQDEFNRVQHEAIANRAGKGESATSLKKPLLTAINNDLVTHLAAMVKVNNALYGDFVAKVEEKFQEVNTRIDKR